MLLQVSLVGMDDEDNDGQHLENGGNCGGGEDTIIRQMVDAAMFLPTDDTLHPPRRADLPPSPFLLLCL